MPAMRTLPEVGLSRPARTCMRVDFPDPDGPMIAANAARREVDAYARQSIDRGLPLAVALAQIDGLEDVLRLCVAVGIVHSARV